ncbi:MAG: TerC family protein [Deltaproteobacteria bacterium]|nr:TerC family protein [Deltaproteobacteria bacterium]MBK8717825.1 TerC family protein [Deltaproteobacteria bacterium]MBP7287813.1 TerC family protein [Nannocystaceae bacterium]
MLWAAFLGGVLLFLLIDLGVFNRKSHVISTREALTWSVVWVCVSLTFNAFVGWRFGREAGLEFLSAYLLEKSLSVDNLFVFIVIFRYMDVRPQVMHRVLFAGIVGALVLRGTFILAGLELIGRFEWLLYAFGGFLLLTGVKLLFSGEEEVDPSGNLAYRMARKVLPLTRRYVGARFFVRQDGRLRATPLFIVLLMIETSDVVFALDSIPAVFGVSRDPFIVFTSNVCAVLGLRAMFFLLQNFLDRFAYLKYGLGLVLAFIGAKMIVAEGLFGLIAPLEVPTGLSLGIVAGLIGASMLVSLVMPPKPDREEVLEHTEAASLIADIDPHASITASVDGSMGASPADISQVAAVPPVDREPPAPR